MCIIETSPSKPTDLGIAMKPVEPSVGEHRFVPESIPVFQLGSTKEVIQRLHPEVRAADAEEAEMVLEALQEYCVPIDEATGGTIFIRGSFAKQLVYESITGNIHPPGWKTPEEIWKHILKQNPTETDALFGPKQFVDRHPEIDCAIELKEGKTLLSVAEYFRVALGELNPNIVVKYLTYADISLLEIFWSDSSLTLQIHEFPRPEKWSWEARTSPYFLFAESYCGPFIAGRNVYTDALTQLFLGSDRISPSFSGASMEQAMIAYQRYVINSFWYSKDTLNELDKKYSRRIHASILSFIDSQKFWGDTWEQSIRNIGSFEGRKAEVATGNVFLLTCCPEFFYDVRNQEYLKQFPIYALMLKNGVPAIDVDKYNKQFRDGTLTASESGPIAFMDYFGISLLELQELFTPIDLFV